MDDATNEIVRQDADICNESETVETPIWLEVIERLLATNEYIDMNGIYAAMDKAFEELSMHEIIVGSFINDLINDVDQYLYQSNRQEGMSARESIIGAINNLPSIKEIDKKRRARLV